MDNKRLLEEIEEKYFKLLKEKVYSTDGVNKSKADEELYHIHRNKASFRFYLAYLMTCYTETTKGYKSFITYDNFDYCFSYLSNLLNMTPFDIDVDKESEDHTNPYSKIPPLKYADSHSMMHQINRLTLNVNINYYHNYKSFLLKYIGEYANIYKVVSEVDESNRFVLVPKGYEVDKTKPFDFTRCRNELKEGEIYFEIRCDYSHSLLRELNKELGSIDIIDSINDYSNNQKEELLYPRLVEELTDNTVDSNAYLFNKYLCDYVIRKHIMIDSNTECPQYFIYVDDVIEKFLKNGYSLRESYTKAKELESRSFDYVTYGNTFDDETNLKNIVNDTEYSDIENKVLFMFYDICAIEFFFKLLINGYKNKYGEKVDIIEKEFKEKYDRLKELGNDNCKGCYVYTKKEIEEYEKK